MELHLHIPPGYELALVGPGPLLTIRPIKDVTTAGLPPRLPPIRVDQSYIDSLKRRAGNARGMRARARKKRRS